MMRASAIRLVFALVLAAPLCPAALQGQSFVLLTQNMLRFGHGSRLQNQCNAIDSASTVVDIIVLQEVMMPGYPCLAAYNTKGVNGAVPANFHYVTSGPKGQSSYKEYYGILYRTNVRNNMQIVGMSVDDNLASATTFMRPPYGVRFQVSDTTAGGKSCNVWIVDIHSVFGKTVVGRQLEAAAMHTVYGKLIAGGTSSVIVAGDWNLPADDAAGFGWVATSNAAIQPNVPTSLTAAGAPSSPYDHVIYTTASAGPSVTLTATATYTGGMAPFVWRTTVSDHVGVVADVSLTC